MDVKYPSVTVRLQGENGNVFNLIAITQAALRRAHVPKDEIEKFVDDAMNAGSYDEVIQLIMKTVNVK